MGYTSIDLAGSTVWAYRSARLDRFDVSSAQASGESIEVDPPAPQPRQDPLVGNDYNSAYIGQLISVGAGAVWILDVNRQTVSRVPIP